MFEGNKSVGFMKLCGEIMKKTFLWALCILCITAIVPFCANSNKYYPLKTEKYTTEDSTRNTHNTTESTADEDYICCVSMEYIDESTDIETKKAVLSLCSNNYYYLKSKEKEIHDPEISTYSDTLLKELKGILAQGVPELSYNGDMVYIPIVKANNGYTATSDEYPYIKSVASPWDLLENRTVNADSGECGISISGIEYLCKNSTTAVDALKWYLPDFQIE